MASIPDLNRLLRPTSRNAFRTPYKPQRTGLNLASVVGVTLTYLLPAPLACCRWELECRRMTPPSNFALRIIVEEDSKLVRTLNAAYADAAPDGGLDAVERDALFDVLGLHFTGHLWPRSGSMDATRRLLANLQRAMVTAGWKVDSFAAMT